ncbi:serine/threonine-protein kinase [Amycolatopsis sp. YIM 10]|uniref:serine/threonine-protein kinase n=1 Tax=Amycolatopsis sp. YIM 10 TaxID=2653857 RepID=UPI0012AA967F|nr:serine/threonine-protein kinase [Amycolatopsis sp. YIM 10]QFU88585.1 Serine/threonine-protein kinase AfsK [Amycolatopsis sp. YIM 10]
MEGRFTPLAAEDPREVGGYRLRARLGVGGMGRVYLAFSPGGRALAIKVVRAEHAEDEEFRRRFEQEIAAARRVQGMYTAEVVDADATAAVPWLATAYVPGPSLRQAVAEHGSLPSETVFRLVAGVAEGLVAVHACDIVHRDLTPANVLLAEDGPRVIDFGIAHAAAATSLTRSGISIGTPAFMAPEQVRGRPATAATDVFALGHLAVFAATGHPAFGEGNRDAMFYRILSEEPELTGCPEDLQPIVRRCLAKEPDDRPSLDEVLAEVAGHAEPRLPGDWLPDGVTQAFKRYDTALYTVHETKKKPGQEKKPKQEKKPQGDKKPQQEKKPQQGKSQRDNKRASPVGGVIAVAALLAIPVIGAIGPEKVLNAADEFFSANSTSTTTKRATGTTTTKRTAATTTRKASTRTTTKKTTTTTTRGAWEGCSEAAEAFETLEETRVSDDRKVNAAAYRKLANSLDSIADTAGSAIDSTLEKLANGYQDVADYLASGNTEAFSSLAADLNDDAANLLDRCRG